MNGTNQRFGVTRFETEHSGMTFIKSRSLQWETERKFYFNHFFFLQILSRYFLFEPCECRKPSGWNEVTPADTRWAPACCHKTSQQDCVSCHPRFGDQSVPSCALFRAVDPEASSNSCLRLFSAVSSKLGFLFFLFATVIPVSSKLAVREGRISCGGVGK